MGQCLQHGHGHEKAAIFESELLESLNRFLPEKNMTFSSDDRPWMTPELKNLERKRKRHRIAKVLNGSFLTQNLKKNQSRPKLIIIKTLLKTYNYQTQDNGIQSLKG